MRIIGLRWLAAAALAMAFALTVPAGAEEAKPGKPIGGNVAVIDVQLIFRDALAMKAVRDQVEVQRKNFQAEISGEENKLRQAGQDLEKQRAVLSAEAYAQKQRDMQQRVSEVQTRVANRRRQLDQTFQGAFNKVQDTLVGLVGDMAKENGYSLVLLKAAVLYNQPAMDITAKALDRLNKKMPTLQVTVPPK
jgi:Skp family chaperone for outer membrane proteins